MGRPKAISKNSIRWADPAPAPLPTSIRIDDERARTAQLQAKLAAKVAERTARLLQRDIKPQTAELQGDWSDDEIAPAATQDLARQLSLPVKSTLTANKENTLSALVGAKPAPQADIDARSVPNPALASPASSELGALCAISERDETSDAEQSNLLPPKSPLNALTSEPCRGGFDQLQSASSIIKVCCYLPACRSPLSHALRRVTA